MSWKLLTLKNKEEQQSVSIEDGMCIIQSLGFDTFLDVVELKSGYLIQGDICLEKVNLSYSRNHKQGRLIILPGLIGHPKQRAITVGV